MSATDWFYFAALLSGELLLVALVTVFLQVCFRSPQAHRCIWQAAFTSMGLLTIIELSGMRENMPWPVRKLHHHYFVTVTTEAAQTQDAPALQKAQAQFAPEPKTAPEIVVWPARIWLAGFILLCTRSLASRIWLGMWRRSALPADEESLWLLAQLQTSLRLSGLHAQSWKGLRGPVAFGVFRPTIALPRDFSERYSVSERQAMLAHEMAHLAARDPFWFLISDVVIALAWWHPAVWLARRKLHLASELCADEASALIPGGPSVLAECLVRFGRELTGYEPVRLLAAGGNGLKSQLAVRIANLLREPETWRPPSAWLGRMTQFSATVVAATAIFLPTQMGISGSILALMISSTPTDAAIPVSPKAQVNMTNQISKESHTGAVQVQTYPPPIDYQRSSNANNIAGMLPIVLEANHPITINSRDKFPMNGPNATGPQVLAKISAEEASGGQSIHDGRTAATSLVKSLPKVSLTVKIILLTEKDSDDLGLDWIFGSTSAETGPIKTSHDWNDLWRGIHFGPPEETNNRPKSVTVDILSAGKSEVLNHEQFAALIERIKAATQDDILASPKIETLSGRQAHIAVEDYKEVVTGVEAKPASANESASVGYFTDKVHIGFSIDIIPTAKEDNNWRLNVVARYMTFEGYDKPAVEPSISVPGGKPIKYHQPLPHFRLLETKADGSTAFGETMAI